MIHENQKYLNGLQVCIDLVAIYISFFLAYYTRFYLLNGNSLFTLSYYLKVFSALLPVYFVAYSWCNLYTSWRIKSFSDESLNIIGCNFFAILILSLYLFIGKDRTQDFSRWLITFFGIFNILITITYRGIIRLLLRHYRRKGYNLKHCLIIGTSNDAHELIHKIKTHPAWGYNIIGCVAFASHPIEAFCGYRVLGNTDELPSIIEKYKTDIVMIATNESEAVQLGKIINTCEKYGIKTHIVPYYHKYIPAKPYMDDLDGLPIIDTRHVPLDNLFKAFLKRSFDIVFSIFALLLCSPLLILSAILIKLTSKGPILFKQERVGLNKETFYMYKFRSMMVQDASEEMTQWTTKNDPRKTWWGNIMRRFSVDELPQFFNVLKGDMSVIGPRPERPYFVDKFKEDIPHYMIKHQVRPGITGWAQVNGLRGDTSIEERIEHDLYYIENWTFSMDLKIIILTVITGFIHKNAY